MLHNSCWRRLLLTRGSLAGPGDRDCLYTIGVGSVRSGSTEHRGLARTTGQSACRSGLKATQRSTASGMVQSTTADLWQRVEDVYDAAIASGALFKTDSTDHVIVDGGIEFIVRVATSLREKAKKKAEGSQIKDWQDPFEPHEAALFVQSLGPGHKLLLNKFNVVAHHCLVVTRQFQHQTERLNPGDLGAAWQLLQAMPHGGVCYFNCGEASGASQPHKHLQVVPLPFAAARPSMPIEDALRQAVGRTAASGKTAAVVEVRQLPYKSFAHQIPSHEQVAPEHLQHISKAVYETMNASTRGAGVHSYNVLLTLQHVIYVPRSRESSGPANVNALGFAGTLFVRSEEELNYLRQHGILRILTDVGLPW